MSLRFFAVAVVPALPMTVDRSGTRSETMNFGEVGG